MDENFIVERICKLRQEKNVSARDMSISVGQNVNYINLIENKKALPSVTTLLYICDYFGITPKEFFDENLENPAKLNEIIEELRKMDNNTLEQFSALAKTLNSKK